MYKLKTKTKNKSGSNNLRAAKLLSPKRKTTTAQSIDDLVVEQLDHFAIDPTTEIGQHLKKITKNLYESHEDLNQLWQHSLSLLEELPRKDRISLFNAKRFLCFQIAKLLDTLMHPMRKSYQSIVTRTTTHSVKGPYPVFDNLPALFSANPVITRTATYIYACAEWIDDAFQGKELMLDIYSRLLNPTSISLANHIIDISTGPDARNYMAWNFNSGMAAIDAILSHLVGYQDIVLCSRNVYGGTYQLLEDWFGKSSNLDINVHWFDGFSTEDFEKALKKVYKTEKDRIKQGRKIYIYIESPCNPHGYVLDVAGISEIAHKKNHVVLCDSTVGTPFLYPILKHPDTTKRPDYVIHSYTKDLSGTGTTTAGVVIGRNETMFIPKNEKAEYTDHFGKTKTKSWDETLFWNVYYIKGAFLDSQKAFDVLTGIQTLEMRMLKKCINTIVLAKVLDAHPSINVHCAALETNDNHTLLKEQLYLGMPCPLFTIDFEGQSKPNTTSKTKSATKTTKPFSRDIFKRFFDNLEPAFGLQVSLGQTNTVVLCPALTSHSELSKEALKEASITPTTIRISVGNEDPRVLLAHLVAIAEQTLAIEQPNFTKQFPTPAKIDQLYKKTYLDIHKRHIDAQPNMAESLG